MKKLNLVSFLFLFGITNQLIAQSDISGIATGHAGTTSSWYVGWDATTNFPLEIRQDNNTSPQPIEFYTGGFPRMTIDGPTGNVGIGAPPALSLYSLKLNVDNDINLNSSAWVHGYWINQKLILSIPGTNNTLVGENAGEPKVTNTYHDNTMVGSYAGGSLTTGHSNTFIGLMPGMIMKVKVQRIFFETGSNGQLSP